MDDSTETPRDRSHTELAIDGVIGVCLVVIGLSALVGLGWVARLKPTDIWHAVGVVIGLMLYGCVAELIVLEGVKKICGDRSWVRRLKNQSLFVLLGSVLLCSAVIVGALVIIVW